MKQVKETSLRIQENGTESMYHGKLSKHSRRNLNVSLRRFSRVSISFFSTLTCLILSQLSSSQAFQTKIPSINIHPNNQQKYRHSSANLRQNHRFFKEVSSFAYPLSYCRRNCDSSYPLYKNVLSPLYMQNDEAFPTTTTSTSTKSSLSSSSENQSEIDQKVYETAIKRTLLSVAASTLFGFSILYWMGSEASEEYFAGYIVEQSLSVDNLFVFLLLFDYFQVPLQYQNRVLNYGIIGSVFMRAIAIGLGSAVLHRFKPVLLVFAGILLSSSVTAVSEFISDDGDDDEEEDMGDNAIVKFSRSLFPTTDKFDEDNFFTEIDGGVKKATPLLLCLVAVEISDIVFAVDSIPAVFGVTEDSFIVFTSNMFAILGLRSLYTVLSKAASDLEYLEPAVAVVLGFIGSKMIGEYFGYLIPTDTALVVVASLLTAGIGASLVKLDSEEDDLEEQNIEKDDI